MKIRIEFTVDVDQEAWAEEMLAEAREVRADVKAWVRQQVEMELGDRGLLMEAVR